MSNRKKNKHTKRREDYIENILAMGTVYGNRHPTKVPQSFQSVCDIKLHYLAASRLTLCVISANDE